MLPFMGRIEQACSCLDVSDSLKHVRLAFTSDVSNLGAVDQLALAFKLVVFLCPQRGCNTHIDEPRELVPAGYKTLAASAAVLAHELALQMF